MILLQPSILFLLCGIICCQENVSNALEKDTKPLQPTDQPQEHPTPTAKFEDPSRTHPIPEATLELKQFAVRRRKCCDDGRQHFYMNGNCANRSREQNEAVGPLCDLKFMECCLFMEAYYMGPVEGCRSRTWKPSRATNSTHIKFEVLSKKEEAQNEKVVPVDGHDSPRKPEATPDPKQLAERRKKCCDDGRQHFYMNGNCANRSREQNEVVGPWCDLKFMECCLFMEAYYMGPVEGCRSRACQNSSPSDSTHIKPEDNNNNPSKKDEVQNENEKVAPVDGHESPRKPEATLEPKQFAERKRKCCDDGHQHFYMNGHCANRSREQSEAVGPWCDLKFLECCLFMETYYMGPVEGCRSRTCRYSSPTDSTNNKSEGPFKKDEEQVIVQNEEVALVDGKESQTKPEAIPDSKQFAERRRKCCEDGRWHFYGNGNCTKRSREQNEVVGPWCDLKFMQCCLFMQEYYMGPVKGCRSGNKHSHCQLPRPTDSTHVPKK
ncbi:uncharacterized protein [Pyxicephalus adspersus]|uniref:uncharacterized protein n=1 Tax=Pyxicephalus adspersus TaxID=30357 RepID=UPI003B599444